MILSSTGVFAVAAALAQPIGMPARRGGAWELKMSGADLAAGVMTTTLCVDPAKPASFSPGAMAHGGPGSAGPQMHCSKQDFHAIAGGWAFSSECPSRLGGVTTTSGTVTGDFKTHLHTAIDIKDARGVKHVVTDERWLGPTCAAGGGATMTLPNGRVISLPPNHG
jgi:hypothetical protein